jgi:hypothetical protein
LDDGAGAEGAVQEQQLVKICDINARRLHAQPAIILQIAAPLLAHTKVVSVVISAPLPLSYLLVPSV